MLYDILIMDLDVTECIWFIFKSLVSSRRICHEKISQILVHTYVILQRYNNNYRPIMHLESYIFTLINTINGYPGGSSNFAIAA